MSFPYSDDLYSALEGDSDVEPQDVPHQETHQTYHNPLQDQAYPDAGQDGPAHGEDWRRQQLQQQEEEEADREQALSPSDGYFGGDAPDQTRQVPVDNSAPHHPNVSHVPNVWVRDPTLEQGSTAESKAREAREEALRNGRRHSDTSGDNNADNTPLPTSPTSSGFASNAPTTTHSHPSSGYAPSSAAHRSRQSGSSSSRAATPHAYPQHQPHASVSTYTPSGTSATSSYRPSSTAPGRSLYSERTSILPHEAPPAYTPSPTSPPVSPTSAQDPTSPDPSRNYRTFSQPFSAMGRHEETRSLLANEPESMANPDEEYADVEVAWRERMRRRVPFLNARNCKALLFGIILLGIAAGFLVSIIAGVRGSHGDDPSFTPPPGDKDEVQRPTTPPGMDYPAIDNDGYWEKGWCSQLKYRYESQQFGVGFTEDNDLTFNEVYLEEPAGVIWGRQVQISGDVVLRRSGGDTPKSAVQIEIATNNEAIKVTTTYDEAKQYLTLSVPHRLPSYQDVGSTPCMMIRINVWIPADGTLDNLSISTINLAVQLLDNLSVLLTESANISTVSGKIVAGVNGGEGSSAMNRLITNGAPSTFFFNARWIEAKTISATISGSWPLYDYLGLTSVSGTIKVGIEPKPVSKSEPRPAILYLKSVSGGINFWEPIRNAQDTLSLAMKAVTTGGVGDANLFKAVEDYIPPRDYRIDVQTSSGSVKGTAAFSTGARVHSVSSSISLNLLPVLDKSLAGFNSTTGNLPVALETSTSSGTTKVLLQDPVWADIAGGSFVTDPEPAEPGEPDVPNIPDLPNLPGVPNVPNIPSPPSPPSPPTFPGSREDDGRTYIPIGDIGDDDPFTILPGHSKGPADQTPGAVIPPSAAAAAAPAPYSSASAVKSFMRCLASRHSTISASIDLNYPTSWEGDVLINTISGSIRTRGKELKTIREGKDWPGVNQQYEGRKGDKGGGALTVKTSSGSVNLLVGEE